MRTKVTLALILLNVALFFFIFYLKSGLRAPHDTSTVLGPEVANLQSIEISGPAHPTVTRLEKRGETWVLTSPIEWPANDFAVVRIVNALQQLNPEASFLVKDLAQTGQTLADYGLDNPPLTVRLTPAGVASGAPKNPLVLRIGNAAKVGNRLYILSPDGQRVHVVQRTLADSLLVKPEDLRSDTLFSIQVFEARSLNVQAGVPTPSKVRIARSDARWFFETPFTTRAIKGDTEQAISQIDALRVQSFPEVHPGDATRLSPEEMSLRITLEGNNRRESLVLGARVPDAAAANPGSTPAAEVVSSASENELYFGKMEDKSPVFVVSVPTRLLNTLRNAQEKLRDRRIVDAGLHADVDPTFVNSVTLSAAGQPDLILQRLESNSNNPLNSAWQIVRRTDEHGQQTMPADREIVDRLIQHLCTLSAEKFVWDAPVASVLEEDGFNRPARRITLVVAPPHADPAAPIPQENVTILIGVGTDRQVYAKLDSPNYVYLVSADILQQTPLDPLVYRERLLRDLPAGARISALKLVDLNNQNVILDTALPLSANPADTSTGSGLNPATRVAVEALAAQLRTLRAKRFVRDEFSNTISIGGEERPWRYLLTATISLVGGNGTQTETWPLFLSERVGGTTQLIGASKLNVVFEAEQPLLDALFALIYGPHDPGPTTPKSPEEH